MEPPFPPGQVELAVRVLNAGLSPRQAALEHGLEAAQIEAYCERFVLKAAEVLRRQPAGGPPDRDARICRLRLELAELIAGSLRAETPARRGEREARESPWSVECL